MKHKFSAFLVAFAVTPAFAASVVMAQFGSFETQAEAQKRVADLKASNADVFSVLDIAVREVKLPPDNLTVYRTQAGPLESRVAAQALCNKLASKGSECYVVETAATSSTSVVPKQPETVIAPKVAQEAVKNPDVTKALEILKPVEIAKPPLAATVPMEALEQKIQAPATGLNAAMNRAAEEQNTSKPIESSSAKVTTTKSTSSSSWSWLNPFSDSEPDMPVKLTEKAKPIEVKAAKEPVAVTKAPVMPMAVSEPSVATPAVATEAQATPILLERTFNASSGSVAQAPAPAARPERLPVRIRERSSTSTSSSSSSNVQPANGSVRVEEARRVPVTDKRRHVSPQALTAMRQTMQPPVLIPAAVPLMPTATLGEKTLWAQVGGFASSQEALQFWDNYRGQHPDFPVLRVRIISGLQKQLQGNENVTLRVGPFARDGFISSLCSSIAGANKQCGQIVDLGFAAQNTTGGTAYLQGSRYKR